MTSKLAQRQLRRAFGVADPAALEAYLADIAKGDATKCAELPDRLKRLLELVDEAYAQFDRDLELRTRSLELSSAELMQANEALQREAKDQVRLSEERLNLAMASAGYGLWDWDIASERLLLDNRWKAMLGYAPEELEDSTATWERLVHADDREPARRAFTEHLAGRRPEISVEYRMRAKDGSWKWIAAQGKVVRRDANGRATRTVGTHRDITIEKLQALDLARAKDAAEAANRAKSDFLANMSHEIRTPMNGVIGMTDLVLQTELAPEQRQYLSIVRSSADALLTVINDILDFSKIEAGKLEFETVEFSLCDLLEETLKALAVRAHQKELELFYRVPAGTPDRLIGDPGRLRQVLLNLLGNAVKFTESGEVELAIALEQQSAREVVLAFAVRDTGIGIPTEKLAGVFDAFAQADSSITRRYGGTGLGLTISKHLVQLMDGRLGVSSKPGLGSTFRFTARFAYVPGTTRGSRFPASPELAGRTVMVVAANERQRANLMTVLEEWGMHPQAFATGAAALEHLKIAAPSVAIVDASLGSDDGLELAVQIAATAPGTRIIALAGGMQLGQHRQRARAAGAVACLAKPTSFGELRDALSGGMLDARAESTLPPRAPILKALTGLRVLLVEDNAVNRFLATKILANDGHEVVTAENGREALAYTDREAFDVILMDLQMPEMDGFEATREIRRRERTTRNVARTPIIALTANAMRGDRERCLEAEMDDHITKPFVSDELRNAIARATQLAR